MILQVHDELLFELPQTEIEKLKELVFQIMPNAIKLSVPVKVDIKAGRSWGDME
jgi:DNA polymerase-1